MKIKSSPENINIWLGQINNDYKCALSVDCVIFGYTDADLYVATIHCNMPPYDGLFSLVGDLVRPDEDADQAVQRVITDRTGLKNLYFEQVFTFTKAGRHPLGRVVSVAYYSLIKLDEFFDSISSVNSDMKWMNVKEIGKLAFDHNEIFNKCFSQLKDQMKERPVGFSLLPKKFTLNQLQELFEIILEIKLDKRNFRRKLLAMEILNDLNEFQTHVSHRPAKYYSFNRELYEKKKSEGFLF
jgi:8-oxo-dGTP diphosphatase